MQASEIHSYTLPSQLTAETVDAVTEALREMPIGLQSSFLINAQEVEHINSSGAQILVSLHKSLMSCNGTLTITDYQPIFSQALADMGLSWLIHPSKA